MELLGNNAALAVTLYNNYIILNDKNMNKILNLITATLFLVLSNSTFSETLKLKTNFTELTADKNTITLNRHNQTLLRLNNIKFNYLSAESWQITDHNQQHITLRGVFPAKADFYRHVEDNKKRFVELTISLIPGGYRLYANPQWGRQVTLEFDYLNDHFFGLSEPLQPDNRLSPDLVNSIIKVDVTAEHASIQENYASAFSAFYMSNLGYGAFFDTFARGEYQFAINGKNKIHHDTGTLDWYLFPGKDGREIHKAYFDLIGTPKSVPYWALGPVGWRDQNNGGAAEILDDIKKLSEMEIPFTSWFVDRPYSDGAHAWSKMNFNKNFANPGEWINTLRSDFGLEFMTWTSPATFGDARFEEHLAGKFSYMDLSHPPTVSSFQSELKTKQYQYGVKGHKIDRGDENFPPYEDWHDASVTAAEKRNKYSYLMAKVHDEALREQWGEDQVTFARAAIHRSQPYLSAIWAGDPRTSWEGLQANFANAARSSFMGFPVWGTDVGGYQGEGYIPANLYLRWMQAGSVSGFFEIKLDGAGGDGRDRMPWQYDDIFQKQFKAICDDRMRFLPYYYSIANTAKTSGTLMQPLAYRHFDDPNTYNIWDQFYLGDALMTAPVFTPQNERSVYFPAGHWRDIDAPRDIINGGRRLNINVPITKLPRYIKRNSLLVSGMIYSGNDKLWRTQKDLLTVTAFPGLVGESTSFIYVDGLNDNQKIPIKMENTKNTVLIAADKFTKETEFKVFMDVAVKSISNDGQAMPYNYDTSDNTLSFKIPAQQPVKIAVNK